MRTSLLALLSITLVGLAYWATSKPSEPAPPRPTERDSDSGSAQPPPAEEPPHREPQAAPPARDGRREEIAPVAATDIAATAGEILDAPSPQEIYDRLAALYGTDRDRARAVARAMLQQMFAQPGGRNPTPDRAGAIVSAVLDHEPPDDGLGLLLANDVVPQDRAGADGGLSLAAHYVGLALGSDLAGKRRLEPEPTSADRQAWLDAAHRASKGALARGPGVALTIMLGSAPGRDPGTVDVLCRLASHSEIDDVRRSALTSLGAVATPSDLQQLTALVPRIPATQDEGLDQMSLFSAMQNAVGRHPEQRQHLVAMARHHLSYPATTQAAVLLQEAVLARLDLPVVEALRTQIERIASDTSNRRLVGAAEAALRRAGLR